MVYTKENPYFTKIKGGGIKTLERFYKINTYLRNDRMFFVSKLHQNRTKIMASTKENPEEKNNIKVLLFPDKKRETIFKTLFVGLFQKRNNYYWRRTIFF